MLQTRVERIFIIACIICISNIAAAGVLYVDNDASGANDGSSWNNAFRYLQDAVNQAVSGDEILVAQGTYYPDLADYASGITEGSRENSFLIPSGVRVQGGYYGIGAADPSDRDIDLCVSVLSGDLEDNDNGFDHMEDNSFNVVNLTDVQGPVLLEGFTITGGNASGSPSPYYYGGGIYISSGAGHIIRSCTLINNKARSGGGAIYTVRAGTQFDSCRFIDNISEYEGGGLRIYTTNDNSESLVKNCMFIGNLAGHDGGGFACRGDTTMVNCVFTGNSGYNGGAIVHGYSKVLNVINCTVVNNTAVNNNGTGLYVSNGIVNLHNSIFWANKVVDTEETGDQLRLYGSTVVTNCCVEGGSSGSNGNISADPMLVDIDGLDDIAGTIDDNFRLISGSPCINAGDNTRLPLGIYNDIEGNIRIEDGTVDMGAFEGGKQGIIVSQKKVIVPEGGTGVLSIRPAMMPSADVTFTATVVQGDSDLAIVQGQNLVFTQLNYQTPQDITVSAAQDPDFIDGKAYMSISADGFATLGILLTEDDDESSTVIYVDDTATGMNNGMNWDNAFNSLQDALEVAHDHPQFESVYVAQGTYYPVNIGGSREVSFDITGLNILGGFAGSGSDNPDARDVELYQTILSGDVQRNDVPAAAISDIVSDASVQDNSYNVVTSAGESVLDGVTVTAGFAMGQAYIHKSGGGYRGTGSVQNCTFTMCYAESGGGISMDQGSIIGCKIYHCMGVYGGGIRGFVEIRDCLFLENYAERGGGMFLDDSEVYNTVLRNNYAEKSGGGMCIHYAQVRIDGCLFADNHSGIDGGGVSVENCGTCTDTADFYNCRFITNSADGKGGGFYYREGWGSSLWNCLFVGNQSYGPGGGVYHWMYAGDQIVNCTFYNNVSAHGQGGIYTTISSNSTGYLRPGIKNCILWNNTGVSGTDAGNDQISLQQDSAFVNNCCVRGWSELPNELFNFGADPLFVNPSGADGLPDTEDDDLRLLSGSPCIDTGDNTPIYGNLDMLVDLRGNPRIYGSTVDLGAYEYSGNPDWPTLYVDASAPDGGNGLSWPNAFNNLHDALAAAEDGFNINIAQGRYLPSDPNGDPEESFVIPVSVSIYGGYSGLQADNPSLREPDKYMTILDGDLNNDDNSGPGLHKNDNSRTIISAVASGGNRFSVVIDGLTIKGAYSDYYNPVVSGGGLKLSLTVNSVISNCVFADNIVYEYGGGLFSTQDDNLIIENCTFKENQAISGMGGAIAFGSSSSAMVKNCLFYRNYAPKGTIANIGSDISVINCTLTENSAADAVAVWSDEGYLELRNSILWEQPTTYAGTGNQVIEPGDSYSIKYCIIRNLKGLQVEEGNMDRNPFFANPQSDDYHLRSIAGRWDPENRVWVKDSVQSCGIDAGSMSSPAGLEPFPNGGVINMGAYGGTQYAGKSWFNKDCRNASVGDINGDCNVDLTDFSILAFHWMESQE